MALKFSQDIQLLLKKLATEPIAIAEMIQGTSERGLILIIALLVLPFLFPMPPGSSTLLGFGCLILGLQMTLGRKNPWLPKKIAEFKFPRNLSQLLLKNVRRVLIWLEKIMRSRWERIANNSYTWRFNGFCITWLAFLLMLPLPGTNPVPASAILILAIATVESDGLVMCLGYFLTLVNTVFFAFIGYALWQAPQLLPNLFK